LKFLSDIINQAWTLLGMFIAWVVLEGSAKTVVGYATIFTFIVWIITYSIRNAEDKE
jgi:hypothetical protein